MNERSGSNQKYLFITPENVKCTRRKVGFVCGSCPEDAFVLRPKPTISVTSPISSFETVHWMGVWLTRELVAYS